MLKINNYSNLTWHLSDLNGKELIEMIEPFRTAYAEVPKCSPVRIIGQRKGAFRDYTLHTSPATVTEININADGSIDYLDALNPEDLCLYHNAGRNMLPAKQRRAFRLGYITGRSQRGPDWFNNKVPGKVPGFNYVKSGFENGEINYHTPTFMWLFFIVVIIMAVVLGYLACGGNLWEQVSKFIS